MTIAHLKKHAKKYASAVTLASAVTALQLAGALTPVFCSMPWVKDKDQCMGVAKSIKEAATEVQTLDSMRLDDGSIVPITEVDGGDQ